MPKAYIVPVAELGFVKVDPESNPVRYGLENAKGRMIEIGNTRYWRSVVAARVAGEKAGYSVEG